MKSVRARKLGEAEISLYPGLNLQQIARRLRVPWGWIATINGQVNPSKYAQVMANDCVVFCPPVKGSHEVGNWGTGL